MRIALSLLVAALLSFPLLPAHSAMPESLEGWRILKTDMAYKDLVKQLNEAVKANKMLLVTRASATAGAKAQGITIPGNMVVGVYRNDFARRMLDASIPAGIEAPIRFYITENGDGSATLSYKTPTAVFSPYFAGGGDALRTLAGELDTLFATIADQAVQ